jgi:putative membrane protein
MGASEAQCVKVRAERRLPHSGLATPMASTPGRRIPLKTEKDDVSSTNLKLLVSVPALVFATWGCGGHSRPPSNTPASSASQRSNDGAGATAETPIVGSPSPTIAGGTGNNAGSEKKGGSTRGEKSTAVTPLSDEQIAEITDNVNSAEIALGKLAQTKSQEPHVTSFAAMMIEHHGKAKRDQAKLRLSEAESPLSRQLKEEAQAKLGELEQKKGREFDLAYLDAQVAGQQKVLAALEQDLLPNAKDERLVSYLQTLKPQVEAHLNAARAARDAVRASAGNESRSPTQRATNSARPC